MIESYGELKTAIQSWLNRSDTETINQIPTFIQLAERRIFRTLRIPTMEVFATADLDPDNDIITMTIPDDFLELKDIWIDTGTIKRQIQRISLQAFNSLMNFNGQPIYFARKALEWVFYPYGPATVNYIYYRDFDHLGTQLDGQGQPLGDADTHAILELAPQLFLYGALSEAQSFLDEDDRTAVWEERYQREMATLEEQARDAEYEGSSLQVSAGYDGTATESI